jgi:hypothetical protein
MTKPLDPVTLEVIRNALPAVANEMAADLQRTSYNMMIYEVRDYCTALINTEGELISQNVGGVSHFVADLGIIITDGMKRYGKDGYKPGDVIITNHQAVAGQHLNNIVIYTPYFYKGELCHQGQHPFSGILAWRHEIADGGLPPCRAAHGRTVRQIQPRHHACSYLAHFRRDRAKMPQRGR